MRIALAGRAALVILVASGGEIIGERLNCYFSEQAIPREVQIQREIVSIKDNT